jgi:hypothetical protein
MSVGLQTEILVLMGEADTDYQRWCFPIIDST